MPKLRTHLNSQEVKSERVRAFKVACDKLTLANSLNDLDVALLTNLMSAPVYASVAEARAALQVGQLYCLADEDTVRVVREAEFYA